MVNIRNTGTINSPPFIFTQVGFIIISSLFTLTEIDLHDLIEKTTCHHVTISTQTNAWGCMLFLNCQQN